MDLTLDDSFLCFLKVVTKNDVIFCVLNSFYVAFTGGVVPTLKESWGTRVLRCIAM